MRSRRRAAVVVLCGVVAATAIAALMIDLGGGGAGGRSTAGGQETSAPTLVSQAPPDDARGPVGRPGPAFDPAAGARPTASQNQAKLWFHDGSWWGAIVHAPTGEFRIHELDEPSQGWVDTGTLIDERPDARPDVLFDGEKLHVASSGETVKPRDAARIMRFSYDGVSRRYTMDADFPVTLAGAGGWGITLAEEPSGRLWAAWVSEGRVRVAHSDLGDGSWAEPQDLATPPEDGDVQSAAIVATTRGAEVVWAGATGGAVHISTFDPGAPGGWRTDSQPIPAVAGADVSVGALVAPAADAGEELLLVTVEIEPPDDNPNRLEPRVLLLKRRGPAWERHMVGRFLDAHSRPVLVVDLEDRRLYVVATAPAQGGAVYYKDTSVDAIRFADGLGTPLLFDPALSKVTDPSSTKQPLDGSTGLVVLAADRTVGRYGHGSVQPRQPNGPADVAVATAPPGAVQILHHRFDPLALDAPLANGWTTRSTDPSASATIVAAPDEQHRSVRISGGAAAGGVRLCHPFAASATTTTVEVELSIEGPPQPGSVLTSLRAGSELVSVRVARNGAVAHTAGGVRVRTSAMMAPGTWYRSVLVVHPETRTYDWELRDRGTSAVLASVAGAAWAPSEAAAPDEICFESPGSASVGALLVDDVLVRR